MEKDDNKVNTEVSPGASDAPDENISDKSPHLHKVRREQSANYRAVKEIILAALLLFCLWRVYTVYQELDDKKHGIVTDARVIAISYGTYSGHESELNGSCYRVTLQYVYSFDQVKAVVYFKKKPQFSIGDTVRVRVDFFDGNRIISMER